MMSFHVPPADRQYSPSTEALMRAELRIQDDPLVIRQLGFEGEIPPLPEALIEECYRTNGTVVLRFPTDSKQLCEKFLRAVVGASRDNFFFVVPITGDVVSNSVAQPVWVNVPNQIAPASLGLPRSEAIATAGGAPADPIDILLMLSYHHLQASDQIPGLKNEWMYTGDQNFVIGCYKHIRCTFIVLDHVNARFHRCGVAPRKA